MEKVSTPEEEPPVLPRTLELERDSPFDMVFRQMQAGLTSWRRRWNPEKWFWKKVIFSMNNAAAIDGGFFGVFQGSCIPRCFICSSESFTKPL